MDIGSLDVKGKGKAKGKEKGKNKDKGKAKDTPDAEMTCYYCGKVGYRKADCWGWQAAQKEKEKEKPATEEEATPKKTAKKDVHGLWWLHHPEVCSAGGSSGEGYLLLDVLRHR